jgi:endonuclease/exonuclease/phosphatase family metal-dependent hydrolase
LSLAACQNSRRLFKEDELTFQSIVKLQRRAAAWMVLGAAALLLNPGARADNPHLVTVMTRNVDAGTDMNYIFAASDGPSFAMGMSQTLAEIKASDFAGRAARLADEIAATKPDLIALQEVTLWRTGPIMQPPATEVMADQLDLLMTELGKRKLHYSIVTVQSLMDAEAPAPLEGIDLRITDRDVILARNDLPRAQFDVSNAQTHRYGTEFHFGSPILGEVVIPRGWMSVDVEVLNSKLRFVNTHLESVYPGVPASAAIQAAEVDELLAALNNAGMPLILAGDFNANAEPGPEHTGAFEKIVAAGFLDSWTSAKPTDSGYTWPLFGEDQLSGPTTPNERIDLIFTGGAIQSWFGRNPNVVSSVTTGTAAPFASDHAGVVVTIRLK